MTRGRLRGYTLIEVLISVSIIVLMVAIVVGTYSLGKNYDTAKAETDKIASLVRNARTRASGGITMLFDQSFCSIGTCSTSSTLCSRDDECPTDEACMFSSGIGCTTNSTCTNANRGHCTRSRYPSGGYGIHLETDEGGQSTYAIFGDLANSPNILPYFNGGPELIEKFRIPSSLTLTFANSAVIAAEIIFNGNIITVYEKTSSGWPNPDSPYSGTTYTIFVEHEENCEKIGKRGEITIDLATFKTSQEFKDCP